MQWCFGPEGLNLARLDDASIVSTQPPIVYAPLQFPYPGSTPTPLAGGTIPGLIGTPVQTQDGADFRILLNPNVHVTFPAITITLDMTSVQQLKKQIGITSVFVLDQAGTYIAYAVNHVGDTRGNNWYTNVRGLTTVNGRLGMAAASKALLNSGL